MATKVEFQHWLKLLVRAVPKFAPDFDGPTMAVWYDGFGADASLDELNRVFCSVRDTCTDFPSIAKLHQLTGRAAMSVEDAGRDVAERIYTALTRGWASSLSPEVQARRDRYVGPIGVEVVRRQGGWPHLGETVKEKDAISWKAHWRELAIVIAKRGPGVLDEGPQWDRLERPRPEIEALLAKLPTIRD